MKTRVRLVAVEGDQEEYADLIGKQGTLSPAGVDSPAKNGLTFMPDNRGDWLTMDARRKTEKDGKVKVTTSFGNVFTFRIL